MFFVLSHYFLKVCHGNQFKYVPHPISKKNYYVLCVPGRAIEMTCNYGECFDEKAFGIPCSVCKSNTTAVDQDTRAHCDKNGIEPLDRVPNYNYCESFYICMGKDVAPFPVKCPSKQYYSVDQKMCIDKIEPTCTPLSKLCENKKPGRFAFEPCHLYYDCADGKIKIETCSYGHKYDPSSLKCIRGSCEKDMRKPNCKGKTNGSKLAHKKCNKFYECSDNLPTEKECPSGQYFDTIQSKCLAYFSGVCTD